MRTRQQVQQRKQRVKVMEVRMMTAPVCSTCRFRLRLYWVSVVNDAVRRWYHPKCVPADIPNADRVMLRMLKHKKVQRWMKESIHETNT